MIQGLEMPYRDVFKKLFIELFGAEFKPKLTVIKGGGFKKGEKNCLFIPGLLCSRSTSLFDGKYSMLNSLKKIYDNVIYYNFCSRLRIYDNSVKLHGLLRESNYLEDHTPFDVLGFSLGGCITRVLIQKEYAGEPNPYYMENIKRAIIMCSPNLGSNPFWGLDFKCARINISVKIPIFFLRKMAPVFHDLFPGKFIDDLNNYSMGEGVVSAKVLRIAGCSYDDHDGLVPYKSAFGFVGDREFFHGKKYSHFLIFDRMMRNGVGDRIEKWLKKNKDA